MSNNEEIDFILPWVDGSDPVWEASYEQYASQEEKQMNKRGERFRDMGLLRFWFRGVEKYAPWVRKIHFVTCGHYPEWLNLDHPNINLVKHTDYIPSRFLPTFNSHTIECNLHRIEGLSERFVLFNDDIFVTTLVSPEDFFYKGLPRDVGIRKFSILGDVGHIDLNDINLINQYLIFWPLFRKNRFKWYNLRYGFHCLTNIIYEPYHDFIGVKNKHSANAYLKNTFVDVWNLCRNELENTCQRKFRSVLDVNQWLFKYWQLAKCQFQPQRFDFSHYYTIRDTDLIDKDIKKKRYKVICINDEEASDFPNLMQILNAMLLREFPEKSSFEID